MDGVSEAKLEVFCELWPEIERAYDRNMAAWEAYTTAGIGNFTRAMVDERLESQKALDRLLSQMASKVRHA